MGMHSLDVNTSTFQSVVIEGSKKVPVLVDFWAAWCAPCRALKPVLEKLAEEYQGRFLLAKVNTDENQELAMRYGVRGIPNVKAFVDGEVRDEFAGALPESMVRQFIERLLPSEAELLRRRATALSAAGQGEEALRLLEQAQALEPGNEWIKVDRAEILLARGRLEEAKALLDSLTVLVRDEPRVAALIARAEFAGVDGEDVETLQKRVAADANDLEARLKLARHYVSRQQYEPALDQLLEIIRRDRSFGDDVARKTMLSVFNLLGNQGELVARYRRLLASALY
ncbi:co-chaperone YbbN [Pelomicrobium methylotrophicum]|uniref:Co-chaperone YbbN n=2 Tax=Pelomicrobium methylotrophicum TaxID=2602750 RepID=A0A5C7EUP3_9PROT|nr:co-chaperone YbbN [Pelomicrobium methylotrophicum]